MPPRGTPGLWPVRILTDFGKDGLMCCVCSAVLLLVVALVAAGARDRTAAPAAALGSRLQFLFLAVLVPLLAGELIKWIVGRGRPFVGGTPTRSPSSRSSGAAAYASFPSAHAITGVRRWLSRSRALAAGAFAMMVYAVLIIASRLVLLAHHPSDVIAGAVFGVVGAMAGALLVRGARHRLRDRPRWRHIAPARTP